MVAMKKRLMDRIGETVKGRIAEAELSPLEDEIRKNILREFARNGRPPCSLCTLRYGCSGHPFYAG